MKCFPLKKLGHCSMSRCALNQRGARTRHSRSVSRSAGSYRCQLREQQEPITANDPNLKNNSVISTTVTIDGVV